MLSSHGCNQAKEQLVHILLTSSINSCLLLKAVCPGYCSNSKQWEGSGNFPTNFMPNLLSVLSGWVAHLRRKTLLLCSQESASLFAVPDHPDQPAPKWPAWDPSSQHQASCAGSLGRRVEIDIVTVTSVCPPFSHSSWVKINFALDVTELEETFFL